MDHEKGRAAIWEFDRASGKGRIFASGPAQPGRHGVARRQIAVDVGQRTRRDSAATWCPTT